MEKNKENEMQPELEPSADADSVLKDQEADQDSESLDDIQKGSEIEATDQQAQEGSETAETLVGQGGEKISSYMDC